MFSYAAIRGQDKSSIVRTIKKRATRAVVWLIIGILRSFDSLHVVVYSCRQHVLIFNAFSEMKRNFESLKLAPSLFYFIFCKEEESYLYVNFFLFLYIQNVISQKSTFSPCVLTVRHLVHSPLVTSEHSGTSQTSDICRKKKKEKNFEDLLSYVRGLRWIMFN